jgi:hypothetical protein
VWRGLAVNKAKRLHACTPRSVPSCHYNSASNFCPTPGEGSKLTAAEVVAKAEAAFRHHDFRSFVDRIAGQPDVPVMIPMAEKRDDRDQRGLSPDGG